MKITVIGGGPGGYKAAFEAAALGAEVTLVERERLGGTCLNKGCIPTKTILKTAHVVADVARGEALGLEPGAEARVSVEGLRDRTHGVVDELVGQLEGEARRLGVEVVKGSARVAGEKLTVVDTEGGSVIELISDAIILATGSVPVELPFIDHSLPGVWTSDDAVALSSIPQRVVIMGGGVIGLEFAGAWAAFGSNVTVVELDKQILPGNDKRVARTLAAELKAQGITILTGTSVTNVSESGNVVGNGLAHSEESVSRPARNDQGRSLQQPVSVTLSNGETIEADVLLSAVGRRPASEGIGLEELGIQTERGTVLVDSFYRTSVDGIYAIGDLIGGYMLAHVAEDEGVAAARNAVAYASGGEPVATKLDPNLIPACVYTTPEVAVIGRTKDGAVADGLDVDFALAKFSGNGKALGEGEAAGFVQLVAEKETGRIVGAQIVGPHAVETIHEVALAMATGATVGDIAHMTHAHPTVSEVTRAAAEMLVQKIV